MLKTEEISSEIYARRFKTALNKWVGPRRKYSVAELAAITGFMPNTIEEWRKEGNDKVPYAWKVALLISAIDEPQFTNAILNLSGYGHAIKLDAPDDTLRKGMELIAEAGQYISISCDNRADGVLTPQEEIIEGEKALSVGMQLISYGKHQLMKYGRMQ